MIGWPSTEMPIVDVANVRSRGCTAPGSTGTVVLVLVVVDVGDVELDVEVDDVELDVEVATVVEVDDATVEVSGVGDNAGTVVSASFVTRLVTGSEDGDSDAEHPAANVRRTTMSAGALARREVQRDVERAAGTW